MHYNSETADWIEVNLAAASFLFANFESFQLWHGMWSNVYAIAPPTFVESGFKDSKKHSLGIAYPVAIG